MTKLLHCGPYIYANSYKPVGDVVIDKVLLSAEQEEFLFYFSKFIDTKYFAVERFVNNFWDSMRDELMLDIDRRNVDYQYVQDRFVGVKTSKRERVPDAHKICFIGDGDKSTPVPVKNPAVEPPGIYLGRSENSRYSGRIKRQIYKKDVTIRVCGKRGMPCDSTLTEKWKRVIACDKDVGSVHRMWLAKWRHPVKKGVYVYMYPDLDKRSVQSKFELAQVLGKHIHRVRSSTLDMIRSSDPVSVDIGAIVYLIDRFVLRIGGLVGDGVYGASTLQKRHVRLPARDVVRLAFPGKDGVMYDRKHKVHHAVYVAMQALVNRASKDTAAIFTHASASSVTRFLGGLLKDLTPKVFRTYHATKCFEKRAHHYFREAGLDAIEAFRAANSDVAVLCNHYYVSKDGSRRLNLATSLRSYVDPRVVREFASASGTPLENLVTGKLLEYIERAR